MSKNDYELIDTLRDPDDLGLVSVITMRDRENGYRAFSFAFFKEFERKEGGPTQRTSYLNERHIPAARKLLDQTERRIAQERDRVHQGRRDRRQAAG